MPSKPRLKQLAQDGATDGQHMVWNTSAAAWIAETPAGDGEPTQEDIATEVITGTDTALSATLVSTPVSNLSLKLALNGVLQRQGATFDYTVSSQTITWLASTGTAVDMDTGDELIAFYEK